MSTTTTTTLNRRGSVPSAVIIPGINGDGSPAKFSDLISLKDLISPNPFSLLSPTSTLAVSSSPTTGGSGYEISIRNRLVKQAAWAYLQSSVASSPSSTSRLCLSDEFLRSVIAGFRKFVAHAVTRVYDWLVDALWLLLCG